MATVLDADFELRAGTQHNGQRLLPLRGRDDHIALINASLQAAAHRNESKILVMQDEPGTGKTRLLLTAVGLARKAGFAVVTGLPAFSGSLPGGAQVAADVPYPRRNGTGAGLAAPGRQDPRHGLAAPGRQNPRHGLVARVHEAV